MVRKLRERKDKELNDAFDLLVEILIHTSFKGLLTFGDLLIDQKSREAANLLLEGGFFRAKGEDKYVFDEPLMYFPIMRYLLFDQSLYSQFLQKMQTAPNATIQGYFFEMIVGLVFWNLIASSQFLKDAGRNLSFPSWEQKIPKKIFTRVSFESLVDYSIFFRLIPFFPSSKV